MKNKEDIQQEYEKATNELIKQYPYIEVSDLRRLNDIVYYNYGHSIQSNDIDDELMAIFLKIKDYDINEEGTIINRDIINTYISSARENLSFVSKEELDQTFEEINGKNKEDAKQEYIQATNELINKYPHIQESNFQGLNDIINQGTDKIKFIDEETNKIKNKINRNVIAEALQINPDQINGKLVMDYIMSARKNLSFISKEELDQTAIQTKNSFVAKEELDQTFEKIYAKKKDPKIEAIEQEYKKAKQNLINRHHLDSVIMDKLDEHLNANPKINNYKSIIEADTFLGKITNEESVNSYIKAKRNMDSLENTMKKYIENMDLIKEYLVSDNTSNLDSLREANREANSAYNNAKFNLKNITPNIPTAKLTSLDKILDQIIETKISEYDNIVDITNSVDIQYHNFLGQYINAKLNLSLAKKEYLKKEHLDNFLEGVINNIIDNGNKIEKDMLNTGGNVNKEQLNTLNSVIEAIRIYEEEGHNLGHDGETIDENTNKIFDNLDKIIIKILNIQPEDYTPEIKEQINNYFLSKYDEILLSMTCQKLEISCPEFTSERIREIDKAINDSCLEETNEDIADKLVIPDRIIQMDDGEKVKIQDPYYDKRLEYIDAKRKLNTLENQYPDLGNKDERLNNQFIDDPSYKNRKNIVHECTRTRKELPNITSEQFEILDNVIKDSPLNSFLKDIAKKAGLENLANDTALGNYINAKNNLNLFEKKHGDGINFSDAYTADLNNIKPSYTPPNLGPNNNIGR